MITSIGRGGIDKSPQRILLNKLSNNWLSPRSSHLLLHRWISSPRLLLWVSLELLGLLWRCAAASKLREIFVIELLELIRLSLEDALIVEIVVRVITRHFS